MMRLTPYCVCLVLCLAGRAWAGAAAPEPLYRCAKGDLYRFEYTKTITIRQPDENGVIGERCTALAAILILEIRDVASGTARGTLRFDSPRVTLPPISFFSAQANEPDPQVEKSRAVAHTLEGAIKVARWSFALHPDGSLHIDGRTPEKLQDWLKDVGNAGLWRKKHMEIAFKLIEQDLGLKVPSVDREILLCPGDADRNGALSCALHPQRSAPTVVSRGAGKLQLGFKRLAPAGGGTPFTIPSLLSSSDVRAVLQNVSTAEGRAVFDTQVSLKEPAEGGLAVAPQPDPNSRAMLDTLDEDYTATLAYTSGADALKQEVHVEYHLKRLAPPISKRK
ncbi:MAG: hypothetical protein NTW87_31040 [Planctomycetota bacterium]|nr:hypothetical protein [Planctomycetota bacterium]